MIGPSEDSQKRHLLLSTPVENVTVMAVENVTLWGEVTSL